MQHFPNSPTGRKMLAESEILTAMDALVTEAPSQGNQEYTLVLTRRVNAIRKFFGYDVLDLPEIVKPVATPEDKPVETPAVKESVPTSTPKPVATKNK